jgi:WD40 repeat protein
VYNFDKLERTHKFDTIANPRGMVSLSSQNDIVLAFPHTVQGQVVVQLLSKNTSHIISAHNGDIACMTLNRDGTLLATASDKGTLIRIWETATGKKLQEVRRGSEKATIYSIAFSHDSNFICTSSDKGTVHVFALSEVHLETDEKNEGDKPVNRKSRLGGLLGGYWGSEWSFAWYNGPEVPSIVAFSADNGSVFLGSGNEVFTKISFDPVKGGECIKKTENKFITDKK